MQCYLKLARSIKPRISPIAHKHLVSCYKRLRSDDAAPGSSSAYRITVRQLEALVRLSEALARLHLRDEVTRSDVKEAYRLLKNSIVQVESPDAELHEDDLYNELEEGADDIVMESDLPPLTSADFAAQQRNNENNTQNIETPEPTEKPDEPTGKHTTVTRVSQAKLNNVKNLFVVRFRELENSAVAGEDVQRMDIGPEGDLVCMPQRDLLKWYFDYLVTQGAITTREDGVKEIVLAEKIVAHLVKREQVLLVVETPERREGEEPADFAKRSQLERLLALNPNYSAD